MKPFAGQQAVKLEDVECNGQGKVIALNRGGTSDIASVAYPERPGLQQRARGSLLVLDAQDRINGPDVTESGKTKMINGDSEVDVSGEDGEEGELVSELARGLGCRSFHPGKDSTSVFPQRNGLPSWEMTEVSWTGRSGGMTGSAVMQR
ncbi:hypothetical protein DFH09DRAFT_1098832 [Mycena vulgaris]|nr:hypothetical protein DFH09DRAFT_1098832 [Mycena vulgaris]